jgi:hypothetical protein
MGGLLKSATFPCGAVAVDEFDDLDAHFFRARSRSISNGITDLDRRRSVPYAPELFW